MASYLIIFYPGKCENIDITDLYLNVSNALKRNWAHISPKPYTKIIFQTHTTYFLHVKQLSGLVLAPRTFLLCATLKWSEFTKMSKLPSKNSILRWEARLASKNSVFRLFRQNGCRHRNAADFWIVWFLKSLIVNLSASCVSDILVGLHRKVSIFGFSHTNENQVHFSLHLIDCNAVLQSIKPTAPSSSTSTSAKRKKKKRILEKLLAEEVWV